MTNGDWLHRKDERRPPRPEHPDAEQRPVPPPEPPAPRPTPPPAPPPHPRTPDHD